LSYAPTVGMLQVGQKKIVASPTIHGHSCEPDIRVFNHSLFCFAFVSAPALH